MRFALQPAVFKTSHVLLFPIDYPVKRQKKKKKKTFSKKFKNSNFTILWTTLVETLPKSIHEFWGAILVCSFTGNFVWKLLPYGPMLAKMKKKTTLAETPLVVCMIFGSESDVYFPGRCRLQILLPCSPMLTKTKSQITNVKFWELKKNIWRYGGQVVFSRNLALISSTISYGRTTDGRTTNALVTTVALLCSNTKQS